MPGKREAVVWITNFLITEMMVFTCDIKISTILICGFKVMLSLHRGPWDILIEVY